MCVVRKLRARHSGFRVQGLKCCEKRKLMLLAEAIRVTTVAKVAAVGSGSNSSNSTAAAAAVVQLVLVRAVAEKSKE